MLIIISCLLLFLLLFFPEISLAGSQYGVTLWLMKLLPTLFPFFIAIKLFQYSLPKLSSRQVFLLTGLLCGYPTGAILVTQQYKKNLLSPSKAYFYLGFVNNPSPMFILSFCGMNVLGLSLSESVPCLLLVILSSLIGSLIFSIVLSIIPHNQHISAATTRQIKSTHPSSAPNSPSLSELLDSIIWESFLLILKIGGYVILFSILGQWLHHILSGTVLWMHVLQVIGSSILEITSGISYMQSIALPLITKKILTTTILTFGGLSAVAQTSSILAKSGLSTTLYVINKVINSISAYVLSCLFFHIF